MSSIQNRDARAAARAAANEIRAAQERLAREQHVASTPTRVSHPSSDHDMEPADTPSLTLPPRPARALVPHSGDARLQAHTTSHNIYPDPHMPLPPPQTRVAQQVAALECPPAHSLPPQISAPHTALTGFSTASQLEIRRLQLENQQERESAQQAVRALEEKVRQLQMQNELQAQDALNEVMTERRRAAEQVETEK